MKLSDLEKGIIYKEKGISLHEEIAEKGYTLLQKDGEWLCDNVTEVQKIIDSFDELEGLKKQKLKELKQEEDSLKFKTTEGRNAANTIKGLKNKKALREYDVKTAPNWNN